MKQLDSEKTKKSKEVDDLQARVTADDQRDEASRREAFALKQKIVATEASREQALKEVGEPETSSPVNQLQPVSTIVKTSLSVIEVWGSITGLVKTARQKLVIAARFFRHLEPRCPGAMPG